MVTLDDLRERKIRVAVLECDTPTSRLIQRNYGRWGEYWRSQLQAWFSERQISCNLIISEHDVKKGPRSYPWIEDVDVLIVSGSGKLGISVENCVIAKYTLQDVIHAPIVHGS
jgi:hypothetical protein